MRSLQAMPSRKTGPSRATSTDDGTAAPPVPSPVDLEDDDLALVVGGRPVAARELTRGIRDR